MLTICKLDKVAFRSVANDTKLQCNVDLAVVMAPTGSLDSATNNGSSWPLLWTSRAPFKTQHLLRLSKVPTGSCKTLRPQFSAFIPSWPLNYRSSTHDPRTLPTCKTSAHQEPAEDKMFFPVAMSQNAIDKINFAPPWDDEPLLFLEQLTACDARFFK